MLRLDYLLTPEKLIDPGRGRGRGGRATNRSEAAPRWVEHLRWEQNNQNWDDEEDEEDGAWLFPDGEKEVFLYTRNGAILA